MLRDGATEAPLSDHKVKGKADADGLNLGRLQQQDPRLMSFPELFYFFLTLPGGGLSIIAPKDTEFLMAFTTSWKPTGFPRGRYGIR